MSESPKSFVTKPPTTGHRNRLAIAMACSPFTTSSSVRPPTARASRSTSLAMLATRRFLISLCQISECISFKELS